MKRILLILFLSTTAAYSADDSCSYFTFCGGSSSGSGSSSSTRSPSFNPSNVARIKGLGVETLLQSNNKAGISMVTGTGRVGGALVSSSTENSFFGNRSLELDQVFLNRYLDKKRYDNKKLNLALGIGIINSKKLELDLGVSLKRNSQIKKINPGVGLSAKYKALTLGAYVYKDDVKIDLLDYSDPYSGLLYSLRHGPTYQETFDVAALTLGIKAGNFVLDVGQLYTQYQFYNDSTSVSIFALGYNFSKVFLTAGFRMESSPNLNVEDNELSIRREKQYYYYGLQVMPFKYLKLGIGYNTFLMKEFSGTVTIFIN